MQLASLLKRFPSAGYRPSDPPSLAQARRLAAAVLRERRSQAHSSRGRPTNPTGERLDPSWYRAPADLLALRLLGCRLQVRDRDGTVRIARIEETEAYLGERDLACHARSGRTERNRSLFGEAGHAYVYLVYGLYRLFNVVAGPPGSPHAVLVRAVTRLDATARGHGPGLASAALGIDLNDDGHDLNGDRFVVLDGPPPRALRIGPRVGVGYAGAWADAPLRYGVAGARHAKPFPSARRPDGPQAAPGGRA